MPEARGEGEGSLRAFLIISDFPFKQPCYTARAFCPIKSIRKSMTDNAIKQRHADLTIYLNLRVKSSMKWRRANSNVALFLMTTAIVSSVAGGIAGLSTFLGPKSVGAIALIPGACALLASQIKFDQRASLNRRRQRRFAALLDRLKFQLPEPPTLDQLALIAAEIAKIDMEIDKEYEKTITSGWNWVQGHGGKK
ncbi:MAG TPA: hypothetical protein VGJ33_01190 [Candidatus Angelobacter sp.]|jgi:hypothetical protein